MRDEYISKFNGLYNKAPHIKKNKNFYSLRISSKTIFEDLAKYSKFGVRKWELPRNLIKSEEAKRNWLRAFFSAEAYVNRTCIRIQTINKKGMKEISKLLHGLGIYHNYYEYNSKNKSESQVFITNISRKESRLKFYKDIGFWHGKKSRVLKESLGL